MLAPLFPYMLGAAISPMLLVTTIMLLGSSQKPKLKTAVFGLAALLTIAIIGFVLFFVIHMGAQRGAPSVSDGIIHIVAGLLILILAWKAWRRGPASARPKKHTKQSILAFFVLGIGLMATNITTIAMYLPAAAELAHNQASAPTRLTSYLLMVLFSVLPILIPLGLVVLLGKHGDSLLALLSRFMQRFGYLVTAGFFVILGVYVVYKGVVLL